MKLKLTPLAAFVSLALAASSSHAATISWSSALYTTGGYPNQPATGQFDSTGTLILAQNLGGGAEIFDGIAFEAGIITFGNTAGVFHEGTPGTNTNLLKTGTWVDNSTPTVTLTGLTTGETYRIQALVYDGRSDNFGSTVSFDGINQGQYAFGVSGVTWGDGLLVTGTFVASGSTQAFTIDSSATTTVLNAITLYQIPEPSAALLGGLGMFGLLRRRRSS